MQSANWFDDVPVIGRMSPENMEAKLEELEEIDADDTWRDSSMSFGFDWDAWCFSEPAWKHTAHVFGFINSGKVDGSYVNIRHVGNIDYNMSLKNSKVKITLDRLRIADYPGRGTHHILFDFCARYANACQVEDVHFNTLYRIREGEEAAIIGHPIFVGLSVGNEGLIFKCFTVNVKNEEDESFLSFLDSDVFKDGLQLGGTLQPAVKLLSHTAVGLTKAIAKRHRNVPVQEFNIGLDFSDIRTRARLAEGSYLAVQVPQSALAGWNWDEWVYDDTNGRIVNAQGPARLLPYNYVVFSVSKYTD